jgi:hypothetical protein
VAGRWAVTKGLYSLYCNPDNGGQTAYPVDVALMVVHVYVDEKTVA